MKTVIALSILLAGTAIATAQQRQPHRQANPPRDLYCFDLQIDEGGTVPTCMSYTLEQCLASRVSTNTRCYLNPIYDPRFRR